MKNILVFSAIIVFTLSLYVGILSFIGFLLSRISFLEIHILHGSSLILFSLFIMLWTIPFEVIDTLLHGLFRNVIRDRFIKKISIILNIAIFTFYVNWLDKKVKGITFSKWGMIWYIVCVAVLCLGTIKGGYLIKKRMKNGRCQKKGGSMNIKVLQPIDGESYRNIRLEALKSNPEAFASSYEEEKENSVDFYKNRLNPGLATTFGAFIENKLVGVVSLVIENKLKLSHRANIYAMYVTPSERGTGIGKKLMLEAINKAREIEGVEQIYLTVVTINISAKHLYHSLGFEIYGEDKRALKIDESYYDETHMVLYL